jgi:hypothetical protein
MSKHFSFDVEAEDDSDVVFRDVITLALLGFVALVIIMLPHINPPLKKDEAKSIDPPGNVIVEARWDDKVDADVDLWVQGPEDVPVGYSNLSGQLFSLLRDDIGKRNDASDLNYENTYSRGIRPGEYIVSLHMYFNRANVWPIKAKVLVSLVKMRGTTRYTEQILVSDVKLTRLGEEKTVFRFKLDKDGNLVKSSVNATEKLLRTEPKGGFDFSFYGK